MVVVVRWWWLTKKKNCILASPKKMIFPFLLEFGICVCLWGVCKFGYFQLEFSLCSFVMLLHCRSHRCNFCLPSRCYQDEASGSRPASSATFWTERYAREPSFSATEMVECLSLAIKSLDVLQLKLLIFWSLMICIF